MAVNKAAVRSGPSSFYGDPAVSFLLRRGLRPQIASLVSGSPAPAQRLCRRTLHCSLTPSPRVGACSLSNASRPPNLVTCSRGSDVCLIYPHATPRTPPWTTGCPAEGFTPNASANELRPRACCPPAFPSSPQTTSIDTHARANTHR